MVVEHGLWSENWGFHEFEDTYFGILQVTEITVGLYVPRFGPQVLDYMMSQPGKPRYESSTVLMKGHNMPGKSFATEKNLVSDHFKILHNKELWDLLM